jgi:uncharacterized membrane protein
MKTAAFILILTTVLVALMAGLFFAYSCSVVPGLGRLSDKEYLSAMQSINRAILNPLFLGCFMGALLLLPLSAWMAYRQLVLPARFWFLFMAFLAYVIGVFGVTVAGNVPMNNILDKLDITGSSLEVLRMQRMAFENRWNFLNHIRTISAIISLVLTLLACLDGAAGNQRANVMQA